MGHDSPQTYIQYQDRTTVLVKRDPMSVRLLKQICITDNAQPVTSSKYVLALNSKEL